MSNAAHARALSIAHENSTPVDEVQQLRERILELEQENERLRHLSHQDELTQLANRRYFDDRLREAFSLRRRHGGAFSLIAVDLDNFKPLNDQHGHAAGDLALRVVAAVLRAATRCTDVVARVGGDEFAVVLPATDKAGALVVAERIRCHIASLQFEGKARLTASIGVTTVSNTEPGTSVEALKMAADLAMYTAKRKKNTVIVTGQEVL